MVDQVRIELTSNSVQGSFATLVHASPLTKKWWILWESNPSDILFAKQATTPSSPSTQKNGEDGGIRTLTS